MRGSRCCAAACRSSARRRGRDLHPRAAAPRAADILSLSEELTAGDVAYIRAPGRRVDLVSVVVPVADLCRTSPGSRPASDVSRG